MIQQTAIYNPSNYDNKVFADHRRWSDKTFGPPNERGPIGPLKHLAKEVVEALEKPYDLFEYADCLLLIVDAAARAGFSWPILLNATAEKLARNQARRWPDWRGLPDLPVEHLKIDEYGEVK